MNDRGGRERFLAAGGTLFLEGHFVCFLGALPLSIPHLAQLMDNDLQV